MVHFAEINQASSSYSMLQYVSRVAAPKLVPRNCLRYLQTTLFMREVDWSQNLCEVLSKKIKKKNGGFEKPEIVFSLNSLFLMFGICQMVLWVIGLLLDHFDLKKLKRLSQGGRGVDLRIYVRYCSLRGVN